MNNSKILTIGCTVVIALTPFSAKAASMKAGLDACADALVTELASSNGAPLDYRVNPGSGATGVRLKRREVIHLDARDPNSQEVVARADCTVDHRANVRELVSVPLDAADAAERATSL